VGKPSDGSTCGRCWRPRVRQGQRQRAPPQSPRDPRHQEKALLWAQEKALPWAQEKALLPWAPSSRPLPPLGKGPASLVAGSPVAKRARTCGERRHGRGGRATAEDGPAFPAWDLDHPGMAAASSSVWPEEGAAREASREWGRQGAGEELRVPFPGAGGGAQGGPGRPRGPGPSLCFPCRLPEAPPPRPSGAEEHGCLLVEAWGGDSPASTRLGSSPWCSTLYHAQTLPAGTNWHQVWAENPGPVGAARERWRG